MPADAVPGSGAGDADHACGRIDGAHRIRVVAEVVVMGCCAPNCGRLTARPEHWAEAVMTNGSRMVCAFPLFPPGTAVVCDPAREKP